MAEDVNHAFNKSRMESLTDGLFATVMTILVLTLVVPVVTGSNQSQQLFSAILALLPSVLVYAASFVVLLVMWIGHNGYTRYIHEVDRKFLWLNGMLLILIGLVPFSTAFLGKYPLEQPAIVLYGINFLALAVMYLILTKSISARHRRFHKEDVSKSVRGLKSNYLTITTYVLSLLFSFVNPYISLALFASMPIYFFTMAMLDPTMNK